MNSKQWSKLINIDSIIVCDAGRVRELSFYVYGYHRGQRGHQIPEMELQTIVSHSMGAGN